jgi:hypothetical protein
VNAALDDDDLLVRLLKDMIPKKPKSSSAVGSPVPKISVESDEQHVTLSAGYSTPPNHLRLGKKRSLSLFPFGEPELPKDNVVIERRNGVVDSPKLRPETLTFIRNYRKVKLIELYRARRRIRVDTESSSIRSEPIGGRVCFTVIFIYLLKVEWPNPLFKN